MVGVIHDCMDIGIDTSSSRQGVAMELHSFSGSVGSGVDFAGMSQHLVDESISVGKGLPVL